MRNRSTILLGWLPVLALAVALAGCRTRPYDDAPLSVDGPLASFDLARPLSCAAVVDCLVGCGAWQLDRPCATGCEPLAKLDHPLVDPRNTPDALQCVQGWCVGSWDVTQPIGTAKCAFDQSGTVLVDAPTVQPGTCRRCLRNLASTVLGLPCTDPHELGCDPRACAGLEDRCSE